MADHLAKFEMIRIFEFAEKQDMNLGRGLIIV